VFSSDLLVLAWRCVSSSARRCCKTSKRRGEDFGAKAMDEILSVDLQYVLQVIYRYFLYRGTPNAHLGLYQDGCVRVAVGSGCCRQLLAEVFAVLLRVRLHR